MTKISRKFCTTAAAAALLISALSGAEVLGAQVERGQSGLPPGPGNPIAALYKQLQSLDARLDAIEAAVTQNSIMWINHLDLVPGGDEVEVFYDSTNSGVGSGLAGLIVMSTTTGETFTGGGNKVLEKGLQVPPNYDISGVRVCYELSSGASFISQIRLAQLQNPPGTALVLHDDGTDLTNIGPICVDSLSAPIDPATGAVKLSLRVNFDNVADKIVIRALGLHLQRTKL